MAAVDEIAKNFTNLFATLRASIVQQLFAIWFGLPGYRDSDLDGWLDVSLPLIQAGQETSATATETYISLQYQLSGGDGVIDPVDIGTVTGGALRGGIPPEEVYSRPFREVWTALAKGKNIQDAIREGADRLRSLVETDIQLAHTHTARQIFSRRSDIQGFRRIPTGVKTCALCMVASTQRYHKLDLMPIHPGCDCRVAPIIGSTSGPRVDRETLDAIHKAIADQFGISARDARKLDYRKILLVREHGEYGPTLTVAKHKFTGPDGLSGKEAARWSSDFGAFATG